MRVSTPRHVVLLYSGQRADRGDCGEGDAEADGTASTATAREQVRGEPGGTEDEEGNTAASRRAVRCARVDLLYS